MLPSGLSKVENPALREFIELCIRHDPEQRPEARQLLKNPFFETIRTGKMSCPGVDRAICERNCEDDAPDGGSSSDEATSTVVLPQAPRSEEGSMGAMANGGSHSHLPALSANGSPDRRPSPPPFGDAGSAAALAAAVAGWPSTDDLSTVAGERLSGRGPGSAAPLSVASDDGAEGHAERDFVVSCHAIEQSSKLSFQLKFVEPAGDGLGWVLGLQHSAPTVGCELTPRCAGDQACWLCCMERHFFSRGQ